MASLGFKNWRGYLYISLGITFGIYRGMKVVEWTGWDLFDLALALGMIAAGLFVLLKK